MQKGTTNTFRRLLTVSVMLSVVVAAGVLLGWLATRAPMNASQLAADTDSPNSAVAVGVPTDESSDLAKPLPQPGLLIVDWKDKLDDVLQSDADDIQKSKRLLELFPNLPEDGQVAVAVQLSILLPNPDYAALAQYLTEPRTPEPVLDVIMAGLLNRADSLKLPILLELAQNDRHPKSAEAKGLLEAMLDESYGTDWSQWQAKVDQWVKEN